MSFIIFYVAAPMGVKQSKVKKVFFYFIIFILVALK